MEHYNTKEEFIIFLEDTLIPDLIESGSEYTAKDFKEAVYWLKRSATIYMNEKTGSCDEYNGWWYQDENDQMVNAVDRDEVTRLSPQQITQLLKGAEL